jgi:hypothetical protein
VTTASACHTKYANSNHIGLLLNTDASSVKGVGAALPVELEPEVTPEAEGEEEKEPDEVDPPADELPPPAATPDVFVPLEWPPGQEEEEEEEDEDDDEEEGEEELRLSLRSGRGPAGTASESRNTSPRMCSAFWAGTPDWLTGCVNTTCTPVAVTVSSP